MKSHLALPVPHVTSPLLSTCLLAGLFVPPAHSILLFLWSFFIQIFLLQIILSQYDQTPLPLRSILCFSFQSSLNYISNPSLILSLLESSPTFSPILLSVLSWPLRSSLLDPPVFDSLCRLLSFSVPIDTNSAVERERVSPTSII